MGNIWDNNRIAQNQKKIFFSILRFEKLIFAGHLGEKTADFGLNFFQKILVFDWEPLKKISSNSVEK